MANTTNFSIEKPSVGGARNSWGGIANVGTDKIDELLALAMPLGTIQMYPLSTAPVATANGGTWLICDGGTKVRTDYPDLYTLIGSTYGAEPSASTFLLPDFQARVPVGYNVAAIGSGVTVRSVRAMAATSGGTEGHILTTAELAAHSHAIPATVHSHDIDNTITHSHTGDNSGKTATASAVINDPEHNHSLQTSVSSWSGGNDYAATGTHIGNAQTTPNSGNKATGITDSGHSHTLTTTANPAGLTVTEDGIINITSTAPDTGSSSSHNNMQPFIVVQYIILAKHPSF